MSKRPIYDMANDLVGLELIIRGKDYGTVLEVVSVSTGHETIYGLITDKDYRLSAVSVLQYIMSSGKQVHYPDGTAYAHYFSGPKGIYSGKAVGGAQMPTTVRIGKETIDITQHMCSNHIIDGVED